jgi:hypothetical protein
MEISYASGSVVIIGLVQVFKDLGVPTRILPLLDIVLGICWALATLGVSMQSVLSGVVLGLSAAGLYRSTKVLVNDA